MQITNPKATLDVYLMPLESEWLKDCFYPLPMLHLSPPLRAGSPAWCPRAPYNPQLRALR
jgi:hypothetical protein